jgi:hypothetical protein
MRNQKKKIKQIKTKESGKRCVHKQLLVNFVAAAMQTLIIIFSELVMHDKKTTISPLLA